MLVTDRELMDPASTAALTLADFAPATYAPNQLGKTQSETPEGYLLCSDVRLARTGAMLYSKAEMAAAVQPGPGTTMIAILRDADVLFDPIAMLSFAGKPVTNDHPGKLVSPSTYRDVDVGTLLNPRRGEGVDSEYFVGDLLIKDARAILDVRAGKREVSLGYDADIEELKPGVGRQTKIVGNHVALVRRGRAGPHCAITDQQEGPMAAARTIFDRLRTAFVAKDEAAFEEELDKAKGEIGGEGQRVIIEVAQPKPATAVVKDGETPTMDALTEARFKGIEDSVKAIGDAVAKLVPTKDADPDPDPKKDPDPDAVVDADPDCDKTVAMDAVAKAEILAPGIKLPAMDAAVKTSVITTLQRDALKVAIADSARKAHVAAVMDGTAADFEKMPAAQVAVVFNAAAALTRSANNKTVTDRKFDIPQGPMTPAKLQELNKARRKATA
jgi:hypothetical protein